MSTMTAIQRPMRRWLRPSLAAAMLAFGLASIAPLGAQGQVKPQPSGTAGWVFTPSLSVAETWDDNVLLATEGSESAGDFLTAVTPRGAVSFRGRDTTFQADYRGSFLLYQQLSELNAFDQRGTVDMRHRLNRSVTFFARNGLSQSPTTDEIELPGIQFRRQGVMLEDLRSGVEARLNARTSLTAAYTFQWVNFQEGDLPVIDSAQGGHSHGAVAVLQHTLNPRLTIGGDFDYRHALLNDRGVFDVQNALATADWRVNERMVLSGGAGYAWLSTSNRPTDPNLEPRRSAPAFRADLSSTGTRFAWNVGYRRSFLPSFGFGGTFQNQEFQANVLAPLTRRLDVSGGLSVRQNEPLVETDSQLHSVWLRTSVGYVATRWMRIEGFYAQTFQDSERPGGKVNRGRFGVQVVTFKRMRIR
jgi:hypothetical protein